MNKDFLENICNVVGHIWGDREISPKDDPAAQKINVHAWHKCERCHQIKKATVQIMYSELEVRKYDILSRAQERLKLELDGEL